MNQDIFEVIINGASTKSLTEANIHESLVKGIKEYTSEDRFNYLVDADNLVDVKKNNTELNKSIAIIKGKGKELVDIESHSINAFKANIKEYIGLIEAKRLERLEDVNVYEDKTRKEIEKLIVSYVYDELESNNVRDGFNDISWSDLVIVSNKNKSGKSLASKCIKELDTRIMVQKSKQDSYDMRVLSLENICYKRGLKVPLDENHIQGIIFEDDETKYNFQLDTLINNELIRAEKQEKLMAVKIREDEEKKAREKVSNQQNEVRFAFGETLNYMDIDRLSEFLTNFENCDLSKFDLCQDYAIEMRDKAIKEITQLIANKKQALQDTKEVIEEIVPVEKVIKEVAPIIEPKTIGTKIVNISISFGIEVKENTNVDNVIKHIKKLLGSEDVNLAKYITSIGVE